MEWINYTGIISAAKVIKHTDKGQTNMNREELTEVWNERVEIWKKLHPYYAEVEGFLFFS